MVVWFNKVMNKLLIIGGIILAMRLGTNIYRIWKTGDRITESQTKLTQVQKKQEELKSQLAQVQTPEFVEKEAREKLGYGREGEVIVILPQNDSAKNEVLSAKENNPNWKKWWDLYIGL
jgi:cell division protein FtsB